MGAKLGSVVIATVGAAAAACAASLHAADLNTPFASESQPQLLYSWSKFGVGSSFGGAPGPQDASPPIGIFLTDPSGVLNGTNMGDKNVFSPNWLLLSPPD